MSDIQVLFCLAVGAAGFCAAAILAAGFLAWGIRCETRRRNRRESENVVWFSGDRRLTVRDPERQRERATWQ